MFEEIAQRTPNKVRALLECEPITAVISAAGETPVLAYLCAEIIKLAGNLNVNPSLNIKGHQVKPIAQSLLENYKWESLEDFTLCFRKAIAGSYGNTYRLDGIVIGQWFARYLDEKYQALEEVKEEQKERISNSDGSKFLEDLLKELEKSGARVPGKMPVNNAKENGYQKFKMERQGQTQEELAKTLRRHELHTQYVRENYDSRYGNPLPTWISEEEWLKKHG